MDYACLVLHTNTFVVPKVLHSLSFTHSHYWAAAAMQHTGKPTGSNLGFSVDGAWGHLDTWAVIAGIQTADPLIIEWRKEPADPNSPN